MKWDEMQSHERNGFIAEKAFNWQNMQLLRFGPFYAGSPPDHDGVPIEGQVAVPNYTNDMNDAMDLWRKVHTRAFSRRTVFLDMMQDQLYRASNDYERKADPMYLLHLMTPEMIARAFMVAWGFDLDALETGVQDVRIYDYLRIAKLSSYTRVPTHILLRAVEEARDLFSGK